MNAVTLAEVMADKMNLEQVHAELGRLEKSILECIVGAKGIKAMHRLQARRMVFEQRRRELVRSARLGGAA